jgi:6,7-dimethyl-8-ribityllumazine synthase
MASEGKNLSKEEQFHISNPEKIKIGIVVSQWNQTITDGLLNGAKRVLLNSKIPDENIIIKHVPRNV